MTAWLPKLSAWQVQEKSNVVGMHLTSLHVKVVVEKERKKGLSADSLS
jgi:hypothetical protein